MSLKESAGVFSGKKFNRFEWYVVDPAAPAGAEASAAAWRRRWAPTNSPRRRRVVATVIAWTLVAIGTFAGCALGALVLQVASFAYFGAICLGLGGFIAGAIIGVKAHGRLAPQRAPEGPKVPGVVLLAPEIVEWPGAVDLPIADLWELNLAVTRTKQVRLVFEEWGPWFENDLAERPTWALENLVEPTLRVELAKQRSELELVSQRVGFPIPQTLSSDPEPFSAYDVD